MLRLQPSRFSNVDVDRRPAGGSNPAYIAREIMDQKRLRGIFDDFLSKLPDQTRDRKTKAAWLLVTCIDCRYPHVIHQYMRAEHTGELYDQLVLAGASL